METIGFDNHTMARLYQNKLNESSTDLLVKVELGLRCTNSRSVERRSIFSFLCWY